MAEVFESVEPTCGRCVGNHGFVEPVCGRRFSNHGFVEPACGRCVGKHGCIWGGHTLHNIRVTTNTDNVVVADINQADAAN